MLQSQTMCAAIWLSAALSLVLLAPTVVSQTETSCGGWCRNISESSSCSGCEGTANCEPIPVQECQRGNWSKSYDLQLDVWYPSRSTHYGGTSGGACGYGNVPNCYSNASAPQQSNGDNACTGVPADIMDSPYAGNYAAPQGDYYAQNILNAMGDYYLSCGSCFEIYCADPLCKGYNKSIVLNLCDACPCQPNPKWCCNIYSHCNEIGPDDQTGQPHCYASDNGLWSNYSLHLDLSDVAMGRLWSGIPNNIGPGVLNTFMRRVSCPAIGNVYLLINAASNYNSECYTVYPNPSKPCFYYLEVNVYNVRGYGGILDVSVNAGRLIDNALVYANFSLLRNPNYPANKTQEQYGTWVNKQNEAIFMPLRFFVTDIGGRSIASPVISDFNGGVPLYYDMQAQFTDPAGLAKYAALP